MSVYEGSSLCMFDFFVSVFVGFHRCCVIYHVSGSLFLHMPLARLLLLYLILLFSLGFGIGLDRVQYWCPWFGSGLSIFSYFILSRLAGRYSMSGIFLPSFVFPLSSTVRYVFLFSFGCCTLSTFLLLLF